MVTKELSEAIFAFYRGLHDASLLFRAHVSPIAHSNNTIYTSYPAFCLFDLSHILRAITVVH